MSERGFRKAHLTTPDPMEHHLTKHHGLGNDFLIAVDPAGPMGSAQAVALCDRRLGVGADGLIVATPEPGADRRRWTMVLWNSDGGRAEISGNGIRCLAQAIAGHLNLDRTTEQELTIDTDAGTRLVRLLPRTDGQDPGRDMVRAAMGKALPGPGPSERWAEVGIDVSSQTGIDIGNPHLVAFVDRETLDGVDMATVGPVIEADYPSGLNVHLVVVEDRSRVRLRVWERGAGVTEACGSGACAAAVAAHDAGLVDSTVAVEMPGGSATVELAGDDVFLIGPAVEVAEVIVHGR